MTIWVAGGDARRETGANDIFMEGMREALMTCLSLY